MKMTGKGSISTWMKITLWILFGGGLLIYITLPICLDWYVNSYISYASPAMYVKYMVFLYITGPICLTMLFAFIKIFETLDKKDPFIYSNVKRLNLISICSFLIGICYAVKIVMLPTILTVIVTMIFILGGFFILILAAVFKQAIKYKEENDLTV